MVMLESRPVKMNGALGGILDGDFEPAPVSLFERGDARLSGDLDATYGALFGPLGAFVDE